MFEGVVGGARCGDDVRRKRASAGAILVVVVPPTQNQPKPSKDTHKTHRAATTSTRDSGVARAEFAMLTLHGTTNKHPHDDGNQMTKRMAWRSFVTNVHIRGRGDLILGIVCESRILSIIVLTTGVARVRPSCASIH